MTTYSHPLWAWYLRKPSYQYLQRFNGKFYLQKRYFAGHSHWQNIKHKKERTDAAKSIVIGKFSREIRAAVKVAGGDNDPKSNFHLDAVIRRAHKASIPNHIIDKALGKVKGDKHANEKLESGVYEAVGVNGTMFVIDVLTENKNRTHQELRTILKKHNCHLTNQNSLDFQFEKYGLIRLHRTLNEARDTETEAMQEQIFGLAMDAGASDVE